MNLDNNKLLEKYKNLVEKYVFLLQQKEDLLYKNKEYLEALCLYKLGKNIKGKLRISIDIKKNHLKITAMQDNINKKNRKDLEELYKDLEDEMCTLEEQFNNFNKKLQSSYKIIKSPQIDSEELLEINKDFGILAKKLSPGMNKGKIKKLWKRTIKAYDLNDLATLKLLMNIFDGKKYENLNDNTNIENINKKISIIEEEISDLSDVIKRAKQEFPFNVEEEIKDPLWIENENEKILEKIEILSAERNIQEDQIKYLEAYYKIK